MEIDGMRDKQSELRKKRDVSLFNYPACSYIHGTKILMDFKFW